MVPCFILDIVNYISALSVTYENKLLTKLNQKLFAICLTSWLGQSRPMIVKWLN